MSQPISLADQELARLTRPPLPGVLWSIVVSLARDDPCLLDPFFTGSIDTWTHVGGGVLRLFFMAEVGPHYCLLWEDEIDVATSDITPMMAHSVITPRQPRNLIFWLRLHFAQPACLRLGKPNIHCSLTDSNGAARSRPIGPTLHCLPCSGRSLVTTRMKIHAFLSPSSPAWSR